jgi:hypothetical protein
MAITYKLIVSDVNADSSRAEVTVEKTDGDKVTLVPYTGVLVDTTENRAKFLETIKNEEIKTQKAESEKQTKIDAVAANLDKDVLQPLTAFDFAKAVSEVSNGD